MKERINRLLAAKAALLAIGDVDHEDIKCIDELVERLTETLDDTGYINCSWGLYPQPEIKNN